MGRLVELRWSGDVELATVTATRRDIDEALDTPDVDRIVIDLAAVNFVDSLGLGMLVYAVNTGETRDVRVTLRNVPDRTLHLIQVAGLSDVLIIEGD